MTPTEALSHFAETRPKNVAFIKDKEIWTYERLATEVDRLARGLIEHGVRKGERVALHMANLPEFAIAYHACFRVGAIAAPLNIRFKTAELTPLLQRLRPALYIGQAALYSQVASIDSSILASNNRFVVVDAPSTTLGCSHGQDYLPRPMASRSESLRTWMRLLCCSRPPEPPASRNS